MVAFNMHNAHVLPVLGVLNDPAFHGFYIVSPWMDNGDLRSHLDGLISQHNLSGKDLVETVNRWVRLVSLLNDFTL